MNKIYKVVWSKVKHCYVVTSELAKRNGKGCGARSLRMAAVSMGVAAALIGGVYTSVAEAGQIFEVGNKTYSSADMFWKPDGNSVTVTASTKDSSGVVVTSDCNNGRRLVLGNVSYGQTNETRVLVYYNSNNEDYIWINKDGVLTKTYLNPGLIATRYQQYIDGYAEKGADVSGYTVTVDMSDVGSVNTVYGGLSQNGSASSNTVNINSGSMDYVYGGESDSGDANGNTVNVRGGTVQQSLYGGSSYGNANDNTVTIYNGSLRYVYGGMGGANSNTETANGNRVTVKNGTVEFVGGAYATNETQKNVVSISGGTIGTSTDYVAVTGAGNYGFNENSIATLNEVMVNGTAQVTGGVYGARDGYGSAIITDNTVTIDGSALVTGNVVGGYGWNRDKTKNKVYIKNGSVTGDVYGGRLNGNYNDEQGDVDGNEVYISGGKVTGKVYGGSVEAKITGDAKNNVVEITGGEVTSEVHGGFSSSANASNIDHNSVSIGKGATVGGNVYGGKIDWDKSGTVTNNSVTMSGGTVAALYGGLSLQAHGTGAVSDNTVEMKGGKLSGYGDIVGGYSTENYTTDNPTKVDVKNNVVKMTGDVDFKTNVVGGWAQGSGLVQNNRVEFSANNVDHFGEGEFTASVTGGKGGAGGATDNKVIFSKGKVYSLTGGSSNGMSGDLKGDVLQNTVEMSGGMVYGRVTGGDSGYGKAENNKVIISKGSVGRSDSDGTNAEISGGRSTPMLITYATVSTATGSGTACHNTVTISDGTFTGVDIRGGFTQASAQTIPADTTATATGTADTNTVTVSGGTFSGNADVYGGYGYAAAQGKGKATATVTVENNTATISGGTYSGNTDVYGGYVFAISNAGTGATAAAEGTAGNNTVEISGGTFSGNVNVYGGIGHVDTRGNGTVSGSVTADKNKVIISGGTINGYIAGGWATVSASGNTVTIKDNAEIGKDARIYGGTASKISSSTVTLGTAADNTVNIEKAITVAALIGGFGDETNSNGNTLNIGATGVQSESVSDFQKIVLTDAVAWDNGKTVLSAKNFDYDDSIKAALDISAATNLASATSGQMTLLASQTDNDLNALSLTYADGTATLNSTTTSVKIKDAASSDDDGSGVIVNAQSTHTVSLDADNNFKNVIYKVESDNVTGVTFNPEKQIAFSTTEVARDLIGKTFAATNTVDVENLKFADSSEAIAKGASMTLVDNATGITTTIDHNTSKTIAIDYEDAQKIKYSATASGDVASDGTAVKFTVDSVILDRMDLTGWTGAPSDVQSETTGWTVNSETSINTGELANAGLAAMNPGDMKTILTADTAVDFSVASITGNKAWQAGGTITDTDTSGVSVAGSTTGGGVTFVNTNKNVLIYQKDKKTIDSITLGSMAFTKDGTVRSFDNTYDLTGAGISATGFSISNASTAIMNTGDEMVVVDATNAIGETKLQEFSKTEKPVAFSDTIEGTILTFAGSRADSLEQNAAKTQIVYKVGDKNVETATLDGTVAWGSAGYQNDNSKYKFSTATNIDATKLKVTGETTEGLTKGSGMTLLYASELASSNTVTQPTDPGTITVNYTNAEGIVFGGDAKGEVKAESGSVNYKVTSVTLTSVGLADWNGTESSMTTSGIGDWTVTDSSQVKVTTGDMANAGLDAMNPGEIKKVLTAVDSVDFSKADISGSKAWKDGGAFDEGTHESGVSVKGSTTGGGVKADDTSKNVLVYQKDKSTVTDITLGAVKYDTSKPARTFDNSYDLTKVVEVAASDFSLSNLDDVKASMNAGDKMVVIDATGAVGNTAIQNFATQNAGAAIEFTDAIEGKALTLSGTHQDTLEAKDATIIYKVGDKSVTKATFTGEVAWNDSEAYYTNDASKYRFNGATDIDVTALKVTGTSTKALKNGDAMMLLSAEGMTAGTVTPQSNASKITVSYSDATSGIGFGAEATGAVSATANAVKYEVNEVTLKTVDLGGWNGTTAVVTEGWSAPVNSVAVNNADAITVVPTTTQAIVTAGSSMFADVNVEKVVDFDPVAQNGVTLTGTQTNTIKTTQTNVANDTITYEVGKKDVKTVDIGTVEWGGEALDGSGADYNYAGASVDHSKFEISNPEQVEANTAMTLLKANETLAEMAEETKKASYAYSPVSGVRIDGEILGNLAASDNKVTFTATANQASQLTFTNVEWKDTLMTRPANIVFDGAKVVTTDIKFTNIDSQVADQTMTLVKNFDGTPSAIEGDHYMVGSGRMGEGAAEMSGNDLIFRAKTGTAPTEATHETVMAMEAGTAVVAAGREYVDSAVEGLGLVSNMAPDGTSTFASMGGGVGRYKTGSHVDTHTWSAVVAVGSKREHKKGNLEWGVFAEYGRGNYTLHDDNGGRGDGDTNYAGGGLLAKWTNKHDVYTEASFRMGRMSDSASNMLRDVLGNTYGYDVHANYFGGHVGLGKIIKVKKNRDLDVYGKYFYLRRNGVDFDAGGNHYTLDSVTSSLLRIGARYGSNDKKWNWYGGLAYEYEFGGESKGTVDGLAIRSASIKGGSVRGEIGMRMEATKTNPWKVDIGIYGYGGKHRGFGGNVSVAYMF